MGGIWDVSLSRSQDLSLRELQEAGLQIVTADLTGESIHSWHPEGPIVLVIGGEANGITDEVKSIANYSVTIPGRERGQGVESLNAGTAASILMHQWLSSS